MQIYSQKDVNKKALQKGRIAILGYGSQGRAHALNLKDSGLDVVVGVRKTGASWNKAKKDGLEVAEPTEAVKNAELIAFLTPDLTQKDLYKEVIGDIKQGATILFAHGFNIHFKQIKPRKDLDVVLIAPKGPGDLVRRQYQQGRGVPCLHGGLPELDQGGEGQRARLCARHRRHPRRRADHDVRRGNRNRSVRRTGGVVRRRHRAGGEGFRDAGGSRLSARSRLLRVPARTEADRRPAA